jgi:hypothetical protein
MPRKTKTNPAEPAAAPIVATTMSSCVATAHDATHSGEHLCGYHRSARFRLTVPSRTDSDTRTLRVLPLP